ncbi:MAG TPA: transcriptional repressor [Bacteroidales bacterium]|nr:transcriptional repressor [Bacteroidales bacterium]
MKLQESSDHLYRQFANALLSRNLKQTQERFAILRAIIQLNAPFQIDFLRKQLLSQKYYVSRSTLYNTMKLMEEISFVDKVIIEGKLFYELKKPQKSIYFIVNQKETKMISLDKEVEDFLISSVETKFNINIKSLKITFYEE